MKSDDELRWTPAERRRLILGMRAAYLRGENVMEYARRETGESLNASLFTLIAYDLQAGSYVKFNRENPDRNARWCTQLAECLKPLMTAETSLLEAGCGEATTLAGVIQGTSIRPGNAFGFDLSWSRCAQGNAWLAEKKTPAQLFVADLFNIPLADCSVDIVYTSHSLEPNGGREEEAIRELMRIARRAVVLVEPIHELASEEARERMQRHGYVRNLKDTAVRLGAKVTDYRLLDFSPNPLNPSGIIVIEKNVPAELPSKSVSFRCPLTHAPLHGRDDLFFCDETGIAYPILRSIPLLKIEHGVIASSLAGN